MHDVFARRLREADTAASQETVSTLGFYFVFYWRKADIIAQTWLRVLVECPREKLLFFWWVANDIIQVGRRKNFGEAFSPVLKDAVAHILKSDSTLLEQVRRVLTIWRQREIFPAAFLDELSEISPHQEPVQQDQASPTLPPLSPTQPQPDEATAGAIPSTDTRPLLQQLTAVDRAIAARESAHKSIDWTALELHQPPCIETEDNPLAHRKQLEELQQSLGLLRDLNAAYETEHNNRTHLCEFLRSATDEQEKILHTIDKARLKTEQSIASLQQAISHLQQQKKTPRSPTGEVGTSDEKRSRRQ